LSGLVRSGLAWPWISVDAAWGSRLPNCALLVSRLASDGTTATGIEMARIPIPCRAERYIAKDGPDTWWPTPEPPHRINQIYLEPVLFACAAATPGLRILNRTRVSDFEQDEDGVLTIAENLDSNESFEI
jgi:hypothetical protein